MDGILTGYILPTKKAPCSRLWALAEQVSAITGKLPNRYLRLGVWMLEHALDELAEVSVPDPITGQSKIRSKAAYLHYLLKRYS